MTAANLPALIPLAYLVTALLIQLAGAWRRSLAPTLAVTGASAGAVLALAGLVRVAASGPLSYELGGWPPPVGIEFVLDGLSAFMVAVVTVVGLVALVHGGRTTATEIPGRVVPFLSASMIFLTGLTGMVLTGDLFNLYVFLEISSLAAYALLAVGSRQAPLSTFRYLTMGTAGASFYLFGLAFLYLEAGTLNMADLGRILSLVESHAPVIMGLTFMGVGMALKMALFPLHGWLPDAYTDASSAGTSLVAPLGTKVAAYVLLRLFFYVLEPEYARGLPLLTAVGYLGIAGVVWGSVMAILQPELKRMLAYSSVSQVGYIAAGIGLASPLGFIAAVLHILNHAFMKACLFLVAGSLRLRRGHSHIPRFDRSLRRAMPWSMAAFALAALSMIGIPPTAGFFSKWYLALAALEQANWVLLAALVASSLLNAVYFFRVLERMYLVPAPEGVGTAPAAIEPGEVPASMLVPTLVLAGGLLVLGLGNAWLVTHLIRPMLPAGL
ncbi:MAG: NADH/ubiquinone/plastoquinone (complex I) [Deltaproteobacteria bacterium]|nr:NADH/ubiquinone/plastoquinone (complex I) [Deltaproteobacteria bacterium]